MLGRIEDGQKGMTEDEMVEWHHPLNGNEFEQALGVGDGQGSLALRIFSITFLAFEKVQLCGSLNIFWHCPSLELK